MFQGRDIPLLRGIEIQLRLESTVVDLQDGSCELAIRGLRSMPLLAARAPACIAEGVNSDGDPERDARAEDCQREELHPNAVVVFNGIPLNGADVIVATFTGQGPGAQQFANTILDVHTVVDEDFRRRIGPVVPSVPRNP